MKSEFVVIGGHYDHVGYKKIHQEGEDFIFNGADDNASGTAGVLAIARGFLRHGKTPRKVSGLHPVCRRREGLVRIEVLL
ncbi:MAG: M28 family peptidase [Marinilabiliales bacterium]|nr:M28 family peptidase [Marinilabiliales bacterium]